jgi:hypothetical protein
MHSWHTITNYMSIIFDIQKILLLFVEIQNFERI